MDYFIDALKKYAQFTGRASRKEFWMFYLILYVLGFLTFTVSDVMASILPYAIFALAMAVPILSITTRRLHDTNRSGWWQLLPLVPLVGAIVLLVFLIQRGKDENVYGLESGCLLVK